MKAIVFDVDWVMNDSLQEKENRIKNILKQHGLYELDWVQETFALSLNRSVFIERIWKLHSFDQSVVLKKINIALEDLEKNPIIMKSTIDFIKKHHKNYQLFTNTSIPKNSLNNTIKWMQLENIFTEGLCWEDSTKLENINYILQKYSLQPEDVLFIDDTLSHINNVKPSWVHTLHFTNKNIDLESYIVSITNK